MSRFRYFINGRRLGLLLLAVSLIAASCSPPVTVTPSETPGPAVKLVFTAQPVGAAAGSALATHPVVTAIDANGNVATGYRAMLVLTITPTTGNGEARLFGGTRVIPDRGVFQFTGLSVDKAGTGYTFTATSGSLSGVSAPFDISPGLPAQLAFGVQPAGSVAGTPLARQPEVLVQDSYGNTVTNYDGTVSVGMTFGSAPSGTVLSGQTTIRAVKGIARFSGLSLNRTGIEFKLTATANDLVSATSSIFKVTEAAPVKLEFTVQPAGAKAGQPFEEQPKVAVEDIYGNVVTAARVSITISIAPGTGVAGAVLSGTNARLTEDGLGGLAEFEDLAIDRAGSGYVLTATASGLTAGKSQPFDVAAK